MSSSIYDRENKIWSAVPVEPIFNFNNSLGQILYHHLTIHGNKVIQIDDTLNTSVTARDAQTWGIRIAQKLKEMQLNHNHVVGISARNSTYVLPVALGCFFNCTPVHSVNPGLGESTIEHCFGLTKPAVIFCDGVDYELMREATKLYKPLIYTITEHNGIKPTIVDLLKSTETEQSYKPEKLVLGMGQTVAILCSSGTTGKPKAVCMSTPTVLINEWFTTNDSVMYSASGIDWITGLIFQISSCIKGFTRIIFSQKYDTDHFLEMVKKYKITDAFFSSRYVATLVQDPRATRENLLSLRNIAFGGSTLSEVSSIKIGTLCGNHTDIFFCYGSTEVGIISYRKGNSKPKSVGPINWNLSMRIVDDKGQNLPHNKVGEILIKSPNPWNGYYGNQDETKRATDSQGWFYTGDLGYMDDDNDLFIVDRKKEILKYQGVHFSPSEIEEVIAEISDVRDFCVVSVFDDTRGDVAGALVVKMDDSRITAQDIIGHVKNRLVSAHKQLNAGVYFVENLPQNLNGKVLKNEATTLLKNFVTRNNVVQV